MAILEWLAVAAVGGIIHKGIKNSRERAAEEEKVLPAILMMEYLKSNFKLLFMRAVPLNAFDIRVSGFRYYRDMVFANVEDNSDLMDYMKRLRIALSDKDIDFDKKRFTPHITLVRRADWAKGFEKKSGNVIDETMKVSRISLMKSEQSKHGMEYTEIGYVKAF